MNSNDKYNILVREISNSKNTEIYAQTYGLEFQEFKSIIDEIENDGLFEKGFWSISHSYIFMGLKFKGKNFLENNDKKEYHKIERKEYNNINITGNNNGNVVIGSNNTINNEFNKKFDDLIKAINNSNIYDKKELIESLEERKENKELLKNFLANLLTRGAEVASIVPLIGRLLGI